MKVWDGDSCTSPLLWGCCSERPGREWWCQEWVGEQVRQECGVHGSPATSWCHGELWGHEFNPRAGVTLRQWVDLSYLQVSSSLWLCCCVGETSSSSCVFPLYSHTTTTLILTPDVWVYFPTSSDSLWFQLVFLQFNSILTLTRVSTDPTD